MAGGRYSPPFARRDSLPVPDDPQVLMQQHPQLELQPPIWQHFLISENLAPVPRRGK
jgi:hypothetical protein